MTAPTSLCTGGPAGGGPPVHREPPVTRFPGPCHVSAATAPPTSAPQTPHRKGNTVNQPTEAQAVISHLPAHAARTLAVEILLSDIAWLRDDVLESCLYILKERLAAPVQQLTSR